MIEINPCLWAGWNLDRTRRTDAESSGTGAGAPESERRGGAARQGAPGCGGGQICHSQASCRPDEEPGAAGKALFVLGKG